MAITAENKQVIIARLPQFKGLPQGEVERILIGMEVNRLRFDDTPIPPSAWVVGTSLKDIYEKTLDKPCQYGGPHLEIYLKSELQIHKIVPIIVDEVILRDMLTMKSDNTVQAAVQLLTSLPFKFAVEKSPQS